MKKILVPTDFSPLANKALDVAVEIARRQNATVEVLNVNVFPTADVGTYYAMYGSKANIDDAWSEIMADAKKNIEEATAKYEGVAIKPVIEETNRHFVDAVLNHDADLIVMGSHGAEGLKELFDGSNSEEVVRLANCPVLVIKDENQVFSPKKVVFSVDLSKHKEFIEKAMATLPIKDAIPHFVYIDTDMKAINYAETKDEMKQLSENIGIKDAICDVYEANTVVEGLLEYIQEVKADMLVMYTHGRTGFKHFLWGSIAEDVMNHSKVPVFTFVEH